MQGHRRRDRSQHIWVGRCYVQTATDRFGDGAKAAIRDRERVALGMHPQNPEVPFVWPGQDSDNENEQPSIYRLIPSMQKFRNNLTALSRAYNLYLVAYQGRIFVYRPRNVPNQTIPRHPDMQLAPRPSAAAREIGGGTDISKPHSINHIITGFLGTEEIVVACYDDGDVIAYYLREIAEQTSAAVQHPIGPTRRRPRPFFHENVGDSAWGLSIHQKSRLIAVSSNRHEVTVFALGLAQTTDKETKPSRSPDMRVRRRSRNWRIVVLLGPGADNVPNVCFVDDESGQAEKVCAVDINGSLWVAHIFKRHQAPVRVPALLDSQLKSEEFYPGMSRGWGVWVLPDDFFMEVDTVKDLFGIRLNEVDRLRSQPGSSGLQWANVRKVLNGITGNPCVFQRTVSLFELNTELLPIGDPPPAGEDMVNAALNLNDADFPILDDLTEDEGVEQGVLDALLGEWSDPSQDSAEDEEAETDVEGEQEQGEEETEPAEEQDGEDEDQDEGDEFFMGGLLEGEDGIGHEWQVENHVAAAAAATATSSGESDTDDSGSDIDVWQITAPAGTDGGVPTSWQVFFNTVQAYGGASGSSSAEKCQGGTTLAVKHRSGSGGAQGADGAGDGLSSPMDMIYFPHNGRIHMSAQDMASHLAFLKRPLLYNTIEDRGGADRSGYKFHIMRTYEKDIELRRFPLPAPSSPGPASGSGSGSAAGPKEGGVVCPDVLRFGRYRDLSLRHHFHATSRLSMIAHVPELSLVVVGSPIGRVALLTLTRMRTPPPPPPTTTTTTTNTTGQAKKECPWEHGFRVEAILPTVADEEAHRRFVRPLHGMAVGPVQRSDGEMGSSTAAALPRTYRLMLHYRNHDILTYEITREEQTKKLCIF